MRTNDNCPICGEPLKRDQWADEGWGVLESIDECLNENCEGFKVQFSYGVTEIRVGGFFTGYSHEATIEERKLMGEAIEAVTKYHKHLYDRSHKSDSSAG